MTKLVSSFEKGLILKFTETLGTKNIFNPKKNQKVKGIF